VGWHVSHICWWPSSKFEGKDEIYDDFQEKIVKDQGNECNRLYIVRDPIHTDSVEIFLDPVDEGNGKEEEDQEEDKKKKKRQKTQKTQKTQKKPTSKPKRINAG
jgi:hypothetical protein